MLPPPVSSSCTCPLSTFLFPAVSLLRVFFGRPLLLWPRGTHCNTCFAVLSFLLVRVRPSHVFLLSSSSTAPDQFFTITPGCWFCLSFFVNVCWRILVFCRVALWNCFLPVFDLKNFNGNSDHHQPPFRYTATVMLSFPSERLSVPAYHWTRTLDGGSSPRQHKLLSSSATVQYTHLFYRMSSRRSGSKDKPAAATHIINGAVCSTWSRLCAIFHLTAIGSSDGTRAKDDNIIFR